VIEYAILAASCAAVAYFARWCAKDIFREKRPEVTDDMIQEAFERDVMSTFDSEFDKVDWED
jgi:hypothetical protein